MARVIGEPPYVRPAVNPPPYTYNPPPITAQPGPVVTRPTVPVTTPEQPPGGGGGGGGAPGGPPDYLALLKNSPGYQAWLASAGARNTNAATDRAQAIRQLTMMFGGQVPGATDPFGDLRPEDLAAAQGNQFSVTADIARQDEAARNTLQRSLAARGMLQSGDLGYGNQQADIARGQTEYNAGQDFLSQLYGALKGYTGSVGAVGAEEPGLIAQLLPLIMQLYPYDPKKGTTDPANPGTNPANPTNPTPATPLNPYLPVPTVTTIRPRPGTGGAGGGGQAI